MHDENLLIQWRRERNAEAFHTLTKKYGGMIYATALRILRDPAGAEDITQTCFEKLATARRAPGHALGPWLHRVAVNAALDAVRSERRRAAREAVFQEAQARSIHPTWDDVYPLVDEAIAELPEKLRQAVIAHYLEQRTHAEIAQAESVSREAVTQRVRRGVELVRERLRKRGVVLGAAALATLFDDAFAAATSLPTGLKARLGQIAVSGLAIQGGGLLAGLLTPSVATALVVAVTAVIGIGTWLAQGGNDSELPAPPPSETAQVSPDNGRSASQNAAAQSPVPADSGIPAIEAKPALSGRVYDAVTGEGIADAKVFVGTREAREELFTDAEGHFAVAELSPGEIYVACRSANGYYVPVVQGDNIHDLRRFDVEPDAVIENVDFALERGESIRGRVVDAAGEPVAGATVTAGAEVQQFHFMNTAVSDADGSFTVSGFPPAMEAWVWAETELLTSASTGPVNLPADAPQALEVVLQPKATLHGRVVYSTGKPVAGVEVAPQYTQHVSVRRWGVETDEQGRFELAGLPAGSLILKAWDGNSILNDHQNFALAPGEQVEGMELMCPLGDARIMGRVVDAQGRGLSRVQVQCRSLEGGHQSSIRSEEDGSFILAGLDPGNYTLEADRFGQYLTAKVQEVSTDGPAVRIVLEELPRAEGRVIDADTNRPVTRFTIKSPIGPDLATHPQRFDPVESDEGLFSVQLNHLEESLIVVRAEGYAFGQVSVVAKQPGEVVRDVEIALQPQADLHGTVHDENGNGIADAAILSGSPPPGLAGDMVACRSGAGGAFTLAASLLGHEFITVVHPNFGGARIEITEKHLAGEDVAVTLFKGASLDCEVFVDGAPAPGVTVYLDCQDCGDAPTERPIQEGGRFTYRGLRAGRYALQALREGSGAQKKEHFNLAENEQASFRIDLHTGDATLQCVLAAGPIMPIMLALHTEGSEAQSYFAMEARETITFTDIPPGPASLIVDYQLPDSAVNIRQRYALDLASGMTTTQEISFSQPAQLTGRLAESVPDETTRVLILFGNISPGDVNAGNYDFERDWCGNIEVGPDGSFAIPALTPGTYTLAASRRGEPGFSDYAVVTLVDEDLSVVLEPAP